MFFYIANDLFFATLGFIAGLLCYRLVCPKECCKK